MLAFNRMNRHGIRFTFIQDIHQPDEVTIIDCYGYKMAVKANIHTMMEAWHQWNNGAFIQDAFSFLPADEREFILSGMTPQQWNKMCQEIEE